MVQNQLITLRFSSLAHDLFTNGHISILDGCGIRVASEETRHLFSTIMTLFPGGGRGAWIGFVSADPWLAGGIWATMTAFSVSLIIHHVQAHKGDAKDGVQSRLSWEVPDWCASRPPQDMARSAQWHTSPDRHVNRISCMQLGYAAALPTEAPVFGYQFTTRPLETWPSTRADSGTDRVSNSLGIGHCRRWARFSVLPVSHRVPGTCRLPSILLVTLHLMLAALHRRH